MARVTFGSNLASVVSNFVRGFATAPVYMRKVRGLYLATFINGVSTDKNRTPLHVSKIWRERKQIKNDKALFYSKNQ